MRGRVLRLARFLPAGLLAACLGDHPVLHPDHVIDPASAILRHPAPIGVQDARVSLEKPDGTRREEWWSGKYGDLHLIPRRRLGDGERRAIRFSGYDSEGAHCYEARYLGGERRLELDSCRIGSDGGKPRLALSLGDTAFIAGDTLSWRLGASLDRGSLRGWSLQVVQSPGESADSGTLSGKSAPCSGSVDLEGAGKVYLTWKVSGVSPLGTEVRAESTVLVFVAPPLRADAGPDTLLPVGRPFLLHARTTGGIGPLVNPMWFVSGSPFRPGPDLVAMAPNEPDSAAYVLWASDARGHTAEDTVFVRFYVPSGAAYARVTPQERPGSAPATGVAAWSSPGPPARASRLERGLYEVIFPDLGAAPPSRGNVQVSSFGPDPARCVLAAVAPGSPSAEGLTAHIRCVNGVAQPIDGAFTVSVLPPLPAAAGINAHARVEATFPEGSEPAAASAWNSGGRIEAYHSGQGMYSILFPGLGDAVGGQGHFQATAEAVPGAWCNVVAQWRTGAHLKPFLNCYVENGKAAPAAMSLSAVGPLHARTDLALAYAVTTDAGNPAADPALTYNSAGGAVETESVGLGRYVAVFRKLGGPTLARPVAAHASAYASMNALCQASEIEGDADLTVKVRCYSSIGAPAAARFSLRVLR